MPDTEQQHRQTKEMTLQEIATALIQKDVTCRWCGSRFNLDNVHCYSHDGGILVKGYERKQWVYMTCPHCGYDWALWKLQHQIKQEL